MFKNNSKLLERLQQQQESHKETIKQLYESVLLQQSQIKELQEELERFKHTIKSIPG